MTEPLTPDVLRKMDAYWRAANYLSVGPDLSAREPAPPRAAAHRAREAPAARALGNDPRAQLRLRAHEPRHQGARSRRHLRSTGPGHGGPGIVANTYLEGTYSEVYPNVSPDEQGMKLLFKQFSFPGGIPSHVAPETPGQHPRRGRARLRAHVTPSAPRSTTRISSSAASSATARRRLARSRRAGTRTSS